MGTFFIIPQARFAARILLLISFYSVNNNQPHIFLLNKKSTFILSTTPQLITCHLYIKYILSHLHIFSIFNASSSYSSGIDSFYMMGYGTTDDLCNTSLGLELGSFHAEQKNCSQPDRLFQPIKKNKLALKYDHMLPSLTLGPSEEVYRSIRKKIDADLQPQASSLSAVSSFSNSSIKKEREFGVGEEVDVERVSSRVSGEDEEGSPRKKLRLTKEQSVILEDNFKDHSTLNPKQKQALAEQLNLRPRQVEVWFQNRRARSKLKQTEVDCELLKKCCEALTSENKRLQKELQELKSLKLASPVYMQLPASTLTMCPSCERICSGSDQGSSTSTFTVGPKPNFYNPSTHSSAAC